MAVLPNPSVWLLHFIPHVHQVEFAPFAGVAPPTQPAEFEPQPPPHLSLLPVLPLGHTSQLAQFHPFTRYVPVSDMIILAFLTIVQAQPPPLPAHP